MFKFSSVPAYSFTKSIKPPHLTDSPGPGAYDAEKGDHLTMKNLATTALLKQSIARPSSKTNNIGPGQYEAEEPFAKVKGFYFAGSGQRGGGKSSDVPGPGQYDYTDTLNALNSSKKNTVFSKAPRPDSVARAKIGVPGPGQYDITELPSKADQFRSNGGHRFTQSTKNNNNGNRDMPGPGAYDADAGLGGTMGRSKGYSVSKAPLRPDSSNKFVPGPGTYTSPDSITSKTGGIKFGKAARRGLERDSDAPAPNTYNILDTDLVQKRSPGIKFGKSVLKNPGSNVPGPGNYEVPTKAINPEQGPRFSRALRTHYKENFVPGPGQYESGSFGSSTNKGKFRFDQQQRGKQILNNAPGPGAYELKGDTGTKYSFQKNPRMGQKMNDIPGPGQYDAKLGNWSQHFPKFVNTKTGAKLTDSVGPGMYDIPHSIPDVPRYNYPGVAQRKIHL